MSEDRGQMSEDRGQMSEDRGLEGWKTGNRKEEIGQKGPVLI